jgi:hypothetical protein
MPNSFSSGIMQSVSQPLLAKATNDYGSVDNGSFTRSFSGVNSFADYQRVTPRDSTYKSSVHPQLAPQVYVNYVENSLRPKYALLHSRQILTKRQLDANALSGTGYPQPYDILNNQKKHLRSMYKKEKDFKHIFSLAGIVLLAYILFR